MSLEERSEILEEVWGLDNTVNVEGFEITPLEVLDDFVEIRVWMRMCGHSGVYTLSATITIDSDDSESNQHIQIHDIDSNLVDEFEIDVVISSPDNVSEITEEIHETYIESAQDWYDFADGAAEAGGQQ